MPSNEEVLQQALEHKKKGNESFQECDYPQAIQAYSQGIVQVDRILNVSSSGVLSSSVVSVKTALLSNRAACCLKTGGFQSCVDDCTLALDLMTRQQSASASASATKDDDDGDGIVKIRSKLLFRRAKGKFLLANLPGSIPLDLLNEGAKDLLNVLSLDPKNNDASTLLKSIRAQHGLLQKSNTPVAKTMDKIRSAAADDDTERIHQLKILLGLLDNDNTTNSMELGRRGGVPFLMNLVTKHMAAAGAQADAATPQPEERSSVRSLALQCLSCAGSHPPFIRLYCRALQKQLLPVFEADNGVYNVAISILALYLRLIMHLDRDDPAKKQIDGHSDIENDKVLELCKMAFSRYEDISVIKATLEVLSLWTSGAERDSLVRAALNTEGSSSSPHNQNMDGLHLPATKTEMDQMTPQQLAKYRKTERERKTRDEAWAFERAVLFCNEGGLDSMLQRAITIDNHSLRREMTVVVGRILVALHSDDKIKETVRSYLTDTTTASSMDALTIEEVFNEDEEEEEGKDEQQAEEEEVEEVSLSAICKRAVVTGGLYIARKDIGIWCLMNAWDTPVCDLEELIDSNDRKAMCLASETIAAAASAETSRHMVITMMDNGTMEKLISHSERDIRSGAASAMAKVGLSNKNADEGEVVGLLQAAADLLEQDDDDDDDDDNDNNMEKEREERKNSQHNNYNKKESLSPSGKDDKATTALTTSFATASIERGIEMVTYLISQTHAKEEIAGGFQATLASKETTLQRLVKVSSKPGAGESLSGFGLATIFQHMAVTAETLRKESFDEKEITMEEYDGLQRLAKTQEEKDMFNQTKLDDSEEACAERIRVMANANVPRALVDLQEGAISEGTLEQIVLSLSRMASEESVRGLMVQQGVLTALIKIEKEDKNANKVMKKVVRKARHCIAKILVTTNPGILTSAQRMGSIKPLIQLIRDVDAYDLLRFESLLSLTNIASCGEDTKNKIVAEKGISTLHFAMFSQNDMVRRAATEALSNLVPQVRFMEHLKNPENLRLWLAFAADFEEHYKCARAAAGCLAMATQDPEIARALCGLKNFRREMDTMFQSGAPEMMHRVVVLIYNLVSHGGECLKASINAGLVAFSNVFVENYHDGRKLEELEFDAKDRALLLQTVEIAKDIIRKV